MSHSLNEIEALAKRAARGGGYSWGMAVETGLAVRKLAAYGLAGPWALAELLTLNDGDVRASHAPQSLDGTWRAEGDLCPLTAGASVQDCARMVKAQGGLVLERVQYPVLLLPFVAAVAQIMGVVMVVEWRGVRVDADGVSVGVTGALADVECALADRVEMTVGGDLGAAQAAQFRGTLDADTMARLTEFAVRTYAPATEESRARGAG